MSEITHEEGRTILFVSHNMGAIQNLCARCVLLKEGAIVKEGDTSEVIDYYLNSSKKDVKKLVLKEKENAPVQVTKMWTENKKGELASEINMGEDAVLNIEYSVNQEIEGLDVGVSLSKDGIPLFYTLDSDQNENLLFIKSKIGSYKSMIELPTSIFKEGLYGIKVQFGSAGGSIGENFNQNAYINLSIVNNKENLTNKSYRKDRYGLIYKKIRWQTKQI